MIDIASISAVVAAIGVIVGVVFTVLQLQDLVKTRQTDLVVRLYSFGSAMAFPRFFPVTSIWKFVFYEFSSALSVPISTMPRARLSCK